ncbi:putative small GTPase, P-loop containing nucleoside triphosphate hydrolase [Helianthus anomalus]
MREYIPPPPSLSDFRMKSAFGVSVDEGRRRAEEEGLFFIETSALDSTNVKEAFQIMIREVYNNVRRKVLNSDSAPRTLVCVVDGE